MNDGIVFEVSWAQDGVPASLDHLVYDDVIVTEEPDVSKPGRIRVTFYRHHSNDHYFQWSLLFLGCTLSGLKAKAMINGKSSVLDHTDDDQKNRWASDGSAEAAS